MSSFPRQLSDVNGTLYFTATDGVHGAQLYMTDGTADGTIVLASFTLITSLHDLINVDGTLYFSVNDRVNGEVLWQSDGTPTGTTPIVGAPGGNFLTRFNGAIYYSSFQPNHGRQLWKSDGTLAGTVPLTDLNTGSPFGFDPSGLTVFNDALYFRASDGALGYQLWKSDGTSAGTVMLTNVNSPGGISPSNLSTSNGTLFFAAVNNHNLQLWKSDGTAAGTGLVATVYASDSLNIVGDMTDVNGTLFFRVNESTGTRLWKSDGTTSGTVSLGIEPVISNLVNYNGTLFFEANDGTHGIQLWKSDGTVAGTAMVTNFNPTHGGLGIFTPLTVADGRLLFAGSDGVNGRALWVSDGTTDGTHMVADINPRPASTNPANFSVVNGVVYFTADDGTHGVELWKVGAVTAGIQVVVAPSATAGAPFAVTVQALNDFGGIDPNYRGTVHFTSSDGRAGLPSDYTFTAGDAGSHTFAGVTLFQAGQQTLTVSDLEDATLTDTGSVLVQPASVASFDVVAAGPVTAGQPFNLAVTARDAYGNAATGYQGTVSLLSLFNTDDLPSSYTFTSDDAGSHTFSVTADQEGLLLLVVTDSNALAFSFTLVPVHRRG